MNDKTEIATLANGCFWCSEAVFKRLKGVKSVLPGYAGGLVKDPSYDQVCTGKTGHAESTQIEFDPKVISFEKILNIFWHTHNPTTLNRQGNDVGTQYRSAIFYHDQKQKELAEKSKKELEEEGVYKDSIVTEITPFKNFFIAEDYVYQRTGEAVLSYLEIYNRLTEEFKDIAHVKLLDIIRSNCKIHILSLCFIS
jgi:peptide-methionine (S)-S-oxide reductase